MLFPHTGDKWVLQLCQAIIGRHTNLQTNICIQGWQISVNRLIHEVNGFSSISEEANMCIGAGLKYVCSSILSYGAEVAWQETIMKSVATKNWKKYWRKHA